MSAFPTTQWFASCPKGMEALLAAELSTLGATATRETVAGVHFEGPLAMAYRACLWSRLANRVLWPIASAPVTDADSLYQALRNLSWQDVFEGRSSFAVNFAGTNQHIRNTQFGAQRSKDAIADYFTAITGRRPSVDKGKPDVRIDVRLAKGELYISVDVSGGSLHQRGYRRRAGAAPLKENLAAAILLRADWPAMAAGGGALIDPMCGGGTLLVEGAMMAADIAPGLGRQRYGFESLKLHNARQWQALLSDAQGRAERGRARQLPEIRGYDADARMVRKAQENIAALGLEKVIRISCKSLSELKKPTHRPLHDGLLICNPPYGERLGDKAALAYLYRELGEAMIREFPGWQAGIFTADTNLGKATGLRSHRRYALWNGAIASSLLLFDLADNTLRDSFPERVPQTSAEDVVEVTEGGRMFANRIRKNIKRLRPWVNREQVECYRLYDADMPEYAVAVDMYGEHAHVAEYQAPKGVDPDAASRRLEEVKAALPEALGLDSSRIVYKQRRRQRGSSQYDKRDSRGELISVREGRARLLVNLHDYLDTGMFLDHRPLRLQLAEEAAGKHFLNLFCYTGTATVHAALGRAASTTSVDMSNTYIGWLRKNLAHNGLAESRNHLVRADCLTWLHGQKARYDLVLLDPPSFSNSSGMSQSFDVQRDQVSLIRSAMAVLVPGGRLYFSNNRRGFKLAPELSQDFHCEDITDKTLGPDFRRNRRIHRCWLMRHK